ncbi:hypothetical protein GQ53DRAFT_828862 [Thozetella sp. PMI_491]|nr:hypothetical protein GQ53DRAFT_828862 [Thozetella sp. PMI_491]
MFDKLFKKNTPAEGEASDPQPKKSLYRKYHDAKTGRNKTISDEDMLKYTGKTKDELEVWAKDRPDVGGNQLSGKIGMGPIPVDGALNWAPPGKQNLKFPPQSQESKKGLDADEED